MEQAYHVDTWNKSIHTVNAGTFMRVRLRNFKKDEGMWFI